MFNHHVISLALYIQNKNLRKKPQNTQIVRQTHDRLTNRAKPLTISLLHKHIYIFYYRGGDPKSGSQLLCCYV